MIEVKVAARRLLLISLALACATLLLRPQLSLALVTRGDDLGYAGKPERALVMYQRALALDSTNVVAADRAVFELMMSHDSSKLGDAIAIATQALRRAPHDGTIEMDRALCYQVLHEYDSALVDFSDVGSRRHDVRALTFAGIDAMRLHRRAQARHLLRLAVAFDRTFAPARRALLHIGDGFAWE